MGVRVWVCLCVCMYVAMHASAQTVRSLTFNNTKHFICSQFVQHVMTCIRTSLNLCTLQFRQEEDGEGES